MNVLSVAKRMLAHCSISFWRSSLVKLAVVAVCGVLAASCQKVPLVAPSGTAITLVPTVEVLPLNGSTDIIAVLIEGGFSGGDDDGSGTTTAGAGTAVHNGTLVTFTTSLGRLEPGEARTEGGRATVRLIADGRSGTARVTAFSGSATESIDITIGAAAAERIAVTAAPQSLPGTGGSTTISARVEDGQGNSLGGVPISFSTTAGSLSRTNDLSSDTGLATTVLTTTQAATVTASAGGASGTVEVTLKPRTTVTIGAPASAIVGVPASFTITPGDNAVLADVVVDFGDGRTVPLGALTSQTQVAHVFRSKGVKTVTATAVDSEGGQESTSTQVGVAPLELSLTASPSTVQAGTVVTFEAVPTQGALIERYEWNFGDGSGPVVTGRQAIRTYPTSGVRIVSVTAFPIENGEPATALAQVNVLN